MRSNVFFKLLKAVFPPLLAGGLALAQFQAASLKSPKTVTLKPGEEVQVEVGFRIRPRYHINSSRPAEDYLIPTRLSWDASPLKLKSIDYPDGEMVEYSFSSKPLSVYSGDFEIRSTFAAPASVPDDLTELTGTLLYQACNDKACFPPQKIQVRVAVTLP